MATEHDPDFEALLHFLKDSRGFDFTGYKRSSLMRRVERRMQQVSAPSYGEYLDYLQLHQDEFTALFNTILINVTGFFRDLEAWGHLRDDALPAVLAERKPSDTIRVWSAGCASGEEAYTAAILLSELLGPDEFRDRVKIYATDVDEEALAQARQAAYPESVVKNVPEEMRERYFEMQGGRYVFRSDLRRSIIFGRNDLVQDAPISRVDLLLCRNTLMYFNAETQSRIVNRFHFAMNTDGVLFLGKAEMLLSHADLFQPIDLKRRFFRKVPRQAVTGARMSGIINGYAESPGEVGSLASLRGEGLTMSPVATLLVTSDGTLAFSNQRADGLFGLTTRDIGRPFRDLEVSYRPVELRSYIDEVAQERRPTWIREVEVSRGPTETVYLDIQIAPLVSADGTHVGVALYFNDVTRYRRLQAELEVTNRQLETAYEELQSTVEELETTNEELQSTNEELETMNEELQSTNEELETMNEELQSTNDELQTINDELRERTQEVNDANAFLEAILRSLHTAVVVVDGEVLVNAWNRRAEDLWGLRAEEVVGQHLLNLDIGLPVERLHPLIRSSLSGHVESEPLVLEAVNRRGRQISVAVTATPLAGPEGELRGAIVLIDEVPAPS
ncbi:MAG TPA: CheR family methyltransferase [Mycobacteriales bacterium]|nr:CheR family methyltransferase [Mycobacteriales bacterium]